MPVDYSKFDHIEDSDDEKPDPRIKEAEERRKARADELRQKMEKRCAVDPAAEAAVAKAEAAKPAHTKDRFAYSESDISKIAKDTLKALLMRASGVQVGNGRLTVADVDSVEGEAMTAQVRGDTRYIFDDFSFCVHFSYQWMGSNFDEGSRRAGGTITLKDFSYETSLSSGERPPVMEVAFTCADALDTQRRKDVQRALGVHTWPPPSGSLMASVSDKMTTWARELPNYMARAKAAAAEDKVDAVGDAA